MIICRRAACRDGPASFLQGFAGYLHADAFSGYDAIFLDPQAAIQEVACWARAPTRSVGLRRMFLDAASSYPRQAHQVLEWIRQLYDLEDRARAWSVDARRELRGRESNPVLDRIEAYLTELARTVLGQKQLGQGGDLRTKPRLYGVMNYEMAF